jgi:hypothetical protein
MLDDRLGDEGAPPFPIGVLRSASPELALDHHKELPDDANRWTPLHDLQAPGTPAD